MEGTTGQYVRYNRSVWKVQQVSMERYNRSVWKGTTGQYGKVQQVSIKIAIRGDGKSPDQKVIDMQLQAANLVYIFDVIILSVTANKSGRLTVETSFLPLNSSKGGTLKCKP